VSEEKVPREATTAYSNEVLQAMPNSPDQQRINKMEPFKVDQLPEVSADKDAAPNPGKKTKSIIIFL
jgi:hypothetical protein